MSTVDSTNVIIGSSATPDNNFKFLIDDLGGMTLKSGGGTNTILDITSAGAIKGVKFPATQVPSADVNTLDDYEEGTWTPAYVLSTPGTSSFGTYGYQQGTYVKIGKQVTVQISIQAGTFTVGTGSGNLSITGLPFAAGSFPNNHGGNVAYEASFVTLVPTGLLIPASASAISIYTNVGAGIAAANCASGITLIATMTYFV